MNNMSQHNEHSKMDFYDSANQYYSQFLFDTLSTAVLYLDQWGGIRVANEAAKKLFGQESLEGKTSFEVFQGWENQTYLHQEVLTVCRTGHSIRGLTEQAIINGKEHWFRTDKIAVQNKEHGFQGVVFTLDDITQLKQHQLSLAKSEASYRAFVNNSHDAIWKLDIDPPIEISHQLSTEELIEEIRDRAVVSDGNTFFNTLYGLGSELRLNSRHLKDIPFEDAIIDVAAFVEKKFHLDDWWTCLDYQGVSRYLQISAQGIIESGKLLSIWGVTRDNTERHNYIEKLEYQNTHDLLTGLPNRVLLQETIEKAIATAPPTQKMALLVIDLDSFKEINDTLGHDAGDGLIKAIGPRISMVLNKHDAIVARLGGDEFAVFLSTVENHHQVERVTKKILAAIRKYFYIDGIEVELRASIGVVVYPDQASDFATLLRYADVAMYCAKHNMSGVNFYDPDQDAHSPKRLALMGELGKAIRSNELTLFFQPKICLEDKKIVGAEALARWIHRDRGFISPGEFVPIAEMTDLINEMTDWVINESLRQMSEWRKRSMDISIAVNISARNLLQEGFCRRVKQLLDYHNVPPQSLELEITESTIMRNTEKTLGILRELNDIGVELSIDDFGTGYSSLAYLKRLPVKRLKIDYSFIINMLESEQDQIIVNSTITMAHNLGLLVVAEGVENTEVMNTLTNMHCEQAQGYHIARPMPPEELEKWVINYNH